MPARSIDTASVVFGLVAIPVKIYSTSEPSHEIHFHLIHAGCGRRLHQQYRCPEHGVVERDAMAKGFEVSKGHVIALAKEELLALESVGTDEIAIREFVPATAVDPIFVERSYYLGPGKGGKRAYRLLRDALHAAEIVAIAAYSARGKAYVVMLRPFEEGLAMHQLRYPDEIKPWSEIPLGDLPKPSASELELASLLVNQLRHDRFDAGAYSDEVKGRVQALLESKAKSGETIVAPEAPRGPVVTDLMAALRASLGDTTRASAAKPYVAPRGKRTKPHVPARTKREPHARPHTKRSSARRVHRA